MDFGNGRWVGHWTGNVHPASTTNPLSTEPFYPSSICARGIYVLQRKLRVGLPKVLHSKEVLSQNAKKYCKKYTSQSNNTIVYNK